MNDQRTVLRHELKYMLNERDYLWLRNRVAALMPLDDPCRSPRAGATISAACIIDDAYDSALFEKVDGDLSPGRNTASVSTGSVTAIYCWKRKAKAAWLHRQGFGAHQPGAVRPHPKGGLRGTV